MSEHAGPSSVPPHAVSAEQRAHAEARFRQAQADVAAQRLEQAAAGYREAAQIGHPGAQLELARMRLYGIDAPADPAEAVHWLQRAEASGHPGASYLLAMIALGGTALPRDARINERLLLAVRHDIAPALRAVAIHFGRKPGDDDQTRCIQMLERAAGRGDVVAAQLLAERLARGEGCPPQPRAAEELWAQLERAGVPRLPAIEAPLPAQQEGRSSTLTLEDVLWPPPWTPLSESPALRRVDRLLSADECRLLVACAQPQLRDSMTVDPVSGEARANPLRTSRDASFDPLAEDFALRCVQLRIAQAAQMELVHAEQLIVLRYAPGQQYRPHRDYLPPATLAGDRPEAGNRARTICVYLNAVADGGATAFPDAGLSVAPQPGCAVVFDNLDADGGPEPRSLHAGEPVVEGEKWLATLWLRERDYRAF
ncbi:2OG-Fe(II) oxygenase [Marilutibacter maris]|uniref:Fe2OG dioxygenase domain-containing protein n=1 Tax=Marilutibacter maris TaxID=1605891 RepID=A0A2U9T4B9_9GAMM|nr:2OG-Fe(II) oxygenase [Lysobacter maris]AWV07566.1 hypothetical protein C9I47_1877 [Lysobacter maris]